MEGRIVPELSRWKPVAPATRIVVDAPPEIHLLALVDSLALAIGLRVVGRRIHELSICAGEHLAAGFLRFQPLGVPFSYFFYIFFGCVCAEAPPEVVALFIKPDESLFREIHVVRVSDLPA